MGHILHETKPSGQLSEHYHGFATQKSEFIARIHEEIYITGSEVPVHRVEQIHTDVASDEFYGTLPK